MKFTVRVASLSQVVPFVAHCVTYMQHVSPRPLQMCMPGCNHHLQFPGSLARVDETFDSWTVFCRPHIALQLSKMFETWSFCAVRLWSRWHNLVQPDRMLPQASGRWVHSKISAPWIFVSCLNCAKLECPPWSIVGSILPLAGCHNKHFACVAPIYPSLLASASLKSPG